MPDTTTDVLTQEPAEHVEASGLEAEVDLACVAVIDAIADWLRAALEQPILRAMSSNAGRALDNADTFPALRAALVGLQANARESVEASVGPLLKAVPPMREQLLAAAVDAVALELAGVIGAPLKDSGFDPLSGGLERIQDGFRLKTMTNHDEIAAAMAAFNSSKAAHVAECAAATERDREQARAEVERLWAATAPD